MRFYSNHPLTVIDGVSEKNAALFAGTGISSIGKLVKPKGDAIKKNISAKIPSISAYGLSAIAATAKSRPVAKKVLLIKIVER